jgi:DNA-binding NarL/FixJ family response regulator
MTFLFEKASSIKGFQAAASKIPVLDMLLLDIGLPDMNGIEGIPIIKKMYPEIDIIMLTTYEENEQIFEALCAGACSYISKRSSLAQITEALKIVADGGSYMSPSIARKISEHFNLQQKKTKIKVTTRQKEIIQLVADGKSYKQIAEICFISLNTVRSHLKKIYALLDVNNKVDLIRKLNDGEIN